MAHLQKAMLDGARARPENKAAWEENQKRFQRWLCERKDTLRTDLLTAAQVLQTSYVSPRLQFTYCLNTPPENLILVPLFSDYLLQSFLRESGRGDTTYATYEDLVEEIRKDCKIAKEIDMKIRLGFVPSSSGTSTDLTWELVCMGWALDPTVSPTWKIAR